MFKKLFHFFLVGMLIFSSFENVFLFAQEISISLEEPFFQEELPQIQSGDEVSGEEIGENDIYIDNQHFQEADDELFEQGIVSSWIIETLEEQLTNSLTLSVETLWTSPSSSLQITEVYRMGNYERIEITNFANVAFEGVITLSGLSTNNQSINVEIPAYSSRILGKTAKGILDELLLMNSLTVSKLGDKNTSWFTLALIVAGQTLDEFSVSSELLEPHREKKDPNRVSIEKVFDTPSGTLQATTQEHLFNISGFVANPWKIFGEQIPREWQEPSDDVGWELPEEPHLPSYDNSQAKLMISEVYYDDDEEWVELYNVGSGNFYGNLTLSGQIFWGSETTFTYTDIFIASWGFIIFANSTGMFTITGEAIILNTGIFPKFIIPEDQHIIIDLLFSGQQVDTFFADQTRVDRRKGKQISFQKIITPTRAIVSSSREYVKNVDDEIYVANPWDIILWDDEDSPADYAIPIPPKPVRNPQCDEQEVVEWELTISEIFRGGSGSDFESYIEFFVHEDWLTNDYTFLFLSGSLLKTGLQLNRNQETDVYDPGDVEKNTRLLLTQKEGQLSDAAVLTLLYHPDFELNSFAWDLVLYGVKQTKRWQTRQLLDIVDITSGTVAKSTYSAQWDDKQKECWDRFSIVNEFSPGFWKEVLEYFSPISAYTTKTEYITIKEYVGGGGSVCPLTLVQSSEVSKLPIEETVVSDDTSSDDISPNPSWETASSGQQLWTPVIKILALDYKSPETITLQSFLSYDVDFTKHLYYLKSSTATTKKYIDGILSADSVDTFTKTFGFPDSWACISLYSGDVQLDELCYAPPTKNTVEEDKTSSDSSFDIMSYQLKILDIVYDPDGADTDNETITIQNLSSVEVDLSNLKLKINTTNKKLTGILSVGETKTFKGTFGFPNSTKDDADVVVSLFYDTTIFDTYVYNPNQPKVVVQSGTVKVYSVLDGDTFRFRKEDGVLQSVRLLWVDAPESTTTRYRTTECFGQEAKTYLTNLIKNQFVRLEYDESQQSVDSYGRLLAYVYLGDTLVNEKILLDGYAKEYTYKTDYQQQSSFQSAEAQAKAQNVWLWSSVTCWQSIEEVPEVRGFDYDKLPLKIASLVYDPDGADKDNEVVALTLSSLDFELSSLSWIDFSDNFKLTIFPRSEYVTWTTKNKSLETIWFLPLTPSFTLTGDRQMPNEKATCVSLKYKEYTFDTKCYHPWKEEETLLSGEVASSELPVVRIVSVLPNPSGTDSEKEEITLVWTNPFILESLNAEEILSVSEKSPLPPLTPPRSTAGSPLGGENLDGGSETLSLSPDFYLLINNKTKKKLNGMLLPNQHITIKGSFSFPNTASCITLMKGAEPIDSFCYGAAKENVRYTTNNVAVQEIPETELSVVKKITLVRQGEKLCISYNKVLFGCKVIPNSTTEQNRKLLSFQNTYIANVQEYLRQQYSLLYYNSELQDLFDLYTTTKKAIKSWIFTGNWKGEEILLTDVDTLFSTQYQQSVLEYLASSVVNRLPTSLVAYYQQEKAKRYAELMNE